LKFLISVSREKKKEKLAGEGDRTKAVLANDSFQRRRLDTDDESDER
jgi:hypothetical protein